MIIPFLLWILYSLLSGVKDGVLYHLKDFNRELNFNEHIIYTLERTVVCILIVLLCNSVIIIPSLLLSFSFVHNGAYYTTRNKLNSMIYPKRWFAQSTSSKAKLTNINTPINRTILFVLGVLIVLAL
jgi:hypothetical protein